MWRFDWRRALLLANMKSRIKLLKRVKTLPFSVRSRWVNFCRRRTIFIGKRTFFWAPFWLSERLKVYRKYITTRSHSIFKSVAPASCFSNHWNCPAKLTCSVCLGSYVVLKGPGDQSRHLVVCNTALYAKDMTDIWVFLEKSWQTGTPRRWKTHSADIPTLCYEPDDSSRLIYVFFTNENRYVYCCTSFVGMDVTQCIH